MKHLFIILCLLSSFSSYAACTIGAYEKVLFDDETSVYEQETLAEYKNFFSEKGYKVVADARAADYEFSYYTISDKSSCMLIGLKLMLTVRMMITNQKTKESWQKEYQESTCSFATGDEFKNEKYEFKKTAILNAFKKIPQCESL